MYLNFLINKKKIFFFLKKFYHKNFYFNFFFFKIIKRIFNINIKFLNLKCYLIKKKIKNNIFYFFLNLKILKFKNIFNFIKIINFTKSIYNIYINKSVSIFNFIKIFFLNLFFNFSKCIIILKINIKIKINFIKYNNIFIKLKNKKKNLLIIKIFFLNYKNILFLFFNNLNINNFLIIIIKIYHFFNNCFSHENFKLININSFLKIKSNVYTKKKIKKIKILQEYINYNKKKCLLNINLNIFIKTKKIKCNHKIFFFNCFYQYFFNLNKKFLEFLCI